MKKTFYLFFFILILFTLKTNAQKKSINWITFEQLEDSLKVKPKKVFISFYADWCAYCKKMKKVAFKDKQIVHLLNKDYYAIKMNSESKDTIIFGNTKYINTQIGKTRKPTHQIPLLLASRKDKAFSLPANIILDKHYKIKNRFFEYLSSKKLLAVLKN